MKISMIVLAGNLAILASVLLFHPDTRRIAPDVASSAPAREDARPGLQLGGKPEAPFRVNIIPPSPEVSALAKYVDIPVSLYTGTPDITIPLFQIQERDLALPVALTYHSSGHKVEDEAPRTGLGWSLRTGGVITRSVRGLPDEYSGPGGFLNQAAELGNVGAYALGTGEQRFQWYENMAGGCRDAEPDVFYFDFAGYSGKFQFDWDGSLVVDSASQLTLIPLGLNPSEDRWIEGWQVHTPDGLRYIFNVQETASTRYSDNEVVLNDPCRAIVNLKKPPQSWHLLEIFSPASDSKIWFEYDDYFQTSQRWSLETKIHNESLAPAIVSREKMTSQIEGKYLRKIETSSGETTIELISGEERTDVEGTGLQTLGIVRVTDRNGTEISRWDFNYDYRTGRLTLISVQERAGSETKPPYQFEYFTGTLPDPLSFRQDQWGFLNNNAAQTLIPETVAFRSDGSPVELDGADRSPALDRLRVGMIRQITYPTGGSDQFVFEPHDYSFEQNVKLEVEQTEPMRITGFAPEADTPPGDEHIVTRPFTLSAPTDLRLTAFFSCGCKFGCSFFMPEISITESDGDPRFFLSPPCVAGQDGETTNQTFVETLRLPAGLYTFRVKAPGFPANPDTLGRNSVSASLEWDVPTGEVITLTKQGSGVRVAKITRSSGFGNPDQVTQYQYTMQAENEEISSGSLLEAGSTFEMWTTYVHAEGNVNVPENKFVRLSQNHTALGATQGSHVGYQQVTIVKGENGENGRSVYRYTSPFDHPDIPVFEVPFPPAFSPEFQRGLLVEQSDYAASGGLVRTITHSYDFQSRRVEALKVGWAQPSDGPAISGPAFLDRYAWVGYTNLLGYARLIETTERLFSPSTFQVALAFQDELNQRRISPALRAVFAAHGFQLSQLFSVVTVIDDQTWRIDHPGASYLIRRNGPALDVHTGAVNVYEEMSGYEYDEDGHKQLIKETHKDSEGVEIITETKYPGDYPAGTNSALDWMVANHELTSMVEQVTYRQGSGGRVNVISALRNDFDFFPGRARLAQVSNARIDLPVQTTDPFQAVQSLYEPRLVYHAYDPFGNILEHSQPDGIVTAYVWDEAGSLPVAVVEGARVDQIFYTSFEGGNEGTQDQAYTGKQSRRVSGVFSIPESGLPQEPGVYRLSYWRKVGSGPWLAEERLISGYQPGDSITTQAIGGFLDEVRLYPAEARMMTFAYQPLIGMMSETDFNGFSTFYEYDSLGRLVAARDHNGDILRAHVYSIGDTPEIPTGNNFIRTYTPQINGLKSLVQIQALLTAGEDGVIQSTDYFDGMARLVQQVTWRGSPLKRDVVKIYSYDPLGRQAVDALPFTMSPANGDYKIFNPANHPLEQFYQAGSDAVADTLDPYAVTRYDGSPLNRIIEQGAPGEAWQLDAADPHFSTYDYRTNTAQQPVPLWKPRRGGGLAAGGSYTPGSLQATAATDENHHKNWIFKDNQDRTVMEMQVGEGSETLRTYYVYDNKGNLTHVIPPKILQGASISIPAALQAREGYQYVYDERNRVVEKHLPGAERIYLVYDRWDRLVLSQDGEQRLENRWSFMKYDVFDRAILDGEIVLEGSRSQVQQQVNDFYAAGENESLLRYETGGDFHGYTNRSYPVLSDPAQVYAATYFDDYAILAEFPSSAAYQFKAESGLDVPLGRAVGQKTAAKVRILDTPDFLYSVTYYDDRYNPIQTIRSSHTGGLNRISQVYDFVGNLTQELSTHEQDNVITRLGKEMVYDHAGRLLSMFHQIDNEEKVLLYRLGYNELGEVIEKDLYSLDGSDTFAQSVDYRYNIRGWLTSINNASLSVEADRNDDGDDLFGMELYYHEEMDGFDNTAQFNGNISAVRWQNAHFLEEQAYVYGYDAFDRLMSAQYENITRPERQGAYDEKGIQYDANGNLVSLDRFRWQDAQVIQIDGLSYSYFGNQLMQVTDSSGRTQGFRESGIPGDDFTYDANGNLVQDQNKRLTIGYNHLNLPEQIEDRTGETIQYVYDANGVKLAQIATGTTTTVTDYAGEFIYENGELRYIRHEEGIIVPNSTGTGWTYQYFLKDHLGNVRLTFAVQPGQENHGIVQVDDYYPFGLQMGGRHFQDPDANPIDHLYNGKELQDELRLDWYDYGARMYDPALGRWHIADEFAENYYSHSPYNYTLNNPLKYVDLNGDFPVGGAVAEKAINRAIRWAAGRGKNLGAHAARHIRFIPARAVHTVFTSPNTIRKLVIQGLKRPGRIQPPVNRLGYYVVETEFEREIGRGGERILHIVFKRTGKIVTAYPVREWTIGAGVFLTVHQLVDRHAMAAVERADRALSNIKVENDSPWYIDVVDFLMGTSSANEGEDEGLAVEHIYEQQRNLFIQEFLESGECSAPELCFLEAIEAFEIAITGTDFPEE